MRLRDALGSAQNDYADHVKALRAENAELEAIARAAEAVVTAHTYVTPGVHPRDAEVDASGKLIAALMPRANRRCASTTGDPDAE